MNVVSFEEKSCERIRKHLDAYVSHELTAEIRLEVVRHLEHCADCNEELDVRYRVKDALKQAVNRLEPAPAALRDKILRNHKPATSWRYWSLAVAASLVLMLGGWLAFRTLNLRSASSLSAQANLNQTLSEHNTEILKIGLGDHVHCALHRDFSGGPRSFERMSNDMGPEFINLVPVINERVPPDYTLMVAHQCQFQGRTFVHLILTKQNDILSIILTKKQAESFDQTNLNAVLKASGVPLYQTHLQDLEVAGFETRDYLAYVVSGLPQEDNLRLASNLAPSVRNFLAKLEA